MRASRDSGPDFEQYYAEVPCRGRGIEPAAPAGSVAMRDTERSSSSSRAAEPKPVEPRSIESGELLGASSQVFILHAGHVYTLRRTKENKLILTK